MGADRTSYADLSFEPTDGGVITSYAETWTGRVRVAMVASVAPDGTTVLLNVGPGDYAMSSKAARELAVALISAAADVECGRAGRPADPVGDAGRAAVQQDARLSTLERASQRDHG